MYIGVGARDLYIDEAHTALEIFHFVVFFLRLKTEQRICAGRDIQAESITLGGIFKQYLGSMDRIIKQYLNGNCHS